MTPATLVTEGKQVTTFSSTAGGTWSTNAGSLWLNESATAPYTGQAETTVYLIAANRTSAGIISRGGDTGSISITGVFPGVPSYPYEFQPDKRGVVVNIKRDGSINGRVLGDGVLKIDYKLVMNNNRIWMYEEVETFWKDHYPNLRFKYYDKLRNFSKYLMFNGRLKVTAQSHNRISYEVETIEA